MDACGYSISAERRWQRLVDVERTGDGVRSAWRSCVENGEVVEEELGGVFVSPAELGSNSELYVTPTSQS